MSSGFEPRCLPRYNTLAVGNGKSRGTPQHTQEELEKNHFELDIYCRYIFQKNVAFNSYIKLYIQRLKDLVITIDQKTNLFIRKKNGIENYV